MAATRPMVKIVGNVSNFSEFEGGGFLPSWPYLSLLSSSEVKVASIVPLFRPWLVPPEATEEGEEEENDLQPRNPTSLKCR